MQIPSPSPVLPANGLVSGFDAVFLLLHHQHVQGREILDPEGKIRNVDDEVEYSLKTRLSSELRWQNVSKPHPLSLSVR